MHLLRKKGETGHPLHWVIESLTGEPSYFEKNMFGCRACYLHGHLVIVLAFSKEPWRGVLVPTEKEFQESLIADYPALTRHPVLGKWLYLPESSEQFEESASRLVGRILAKDRRFGVESKRKVGARRGRAGGAPDPL